MTGVLPPFLLTGQFTAASAGPSTPLFGSFTVAIWGSPPGGGGEPATWSGTVQLERSTDGGTTWLPVSTDSLGTPAKYTSSVVVQGAEYEPIALYRLNCLEYSSGTIAYRIAAQMTFP